MDKSVNFKCDTICVKYVYSRNFVFVYNFPMITISFPIFLFFTFNKMPTGAVASKPDEEWSISPRILSTKSSAFRKLPLLFWPGFFLSPTSDGFFVFLIRPQNEWKRRFQMILSSGNTPTKLDCPIKKKLLTASCQYFAIFCNTMPMPIFSLTVQGFL